MVKPLGPLGLGKTDVSPFECIDEKHHKWTLKGGSDTVSIYQCWKCKAYFIYDKYPINKV